MSRSEKCNMDVHMDVVIYYFTQLLSEDACVSSYGILYREYNSYRMWKCSAPKTSGKQPQHRSLIPIFYIEHSVTEYISTLRCCFDIYYLCMFCLIHDLCTHFWFDILCKFHVKCIHGSCVALYTRQLLHCINSFIRIPRLYLFPGLMVMCFRTEVSLSFLLVE